MLALRPRPLLGVRSRAPGHDRAIATPAAWARRAWFATAAAANALLAAVLVRHGDLPDHAVEASLAVFCIAVAARYDRIVRGAHTLGLAWPSYRLHQLTYHLGQLHRAMAVAGTAWFALAVAAGAARGDVLGRSVGAVVLGILVTMAWTARAPVRRLHHDAFEAIHRFAGWAALAALVVLVLRRSSAGAPANAGVLDVLGQPAVLLLIVLVALVVHPWLGVERIAAEVLDVTAHVVVVAVPGSVGRGEFLRISRDGREWHSFAVSTIGREGEGRCSLVIRRAGDWTEQLGRDAEAGRGPTSLLVRRQRGYGFMVHVQAYRRVLLVATGAGIGPVLPYLLDDEGPELECLWIGRDHDSAMGSDVVEQVRRRRQVVLVDTARGRPAVGELVAERAGRFDAVFVVSNATVRDEVAGACAALGVPCYGPTFDS